MRIQTITSRQTHVATAVEEEEEEVEEEEQSVVEL